VADIHDWLDQLVASGHLCRDGEYPVLRLTDLGKRLMLGEGEVQLTVPRKPAASRKHAAAAAVQDADETLFQELRLLRRRLAQERGVPPYLIFGDATLLEMSARKPTTDGAMRGIKGVGDRKAAELGPIFLDAIRAYVYGQAVETA
jgi:ATP-dependent DNA helicase RecQ